MIQEQVQRYIEGLVDSGSETGMQVAAYHGGALIVDAVAGVADAATGRPVTADTPFFSFSMGKNMSATIAHLLVARGFLGYDSPVEERWPEFGVHGKAAVTLRHVLTHTVGLPAMPTEVTPDDLSDWDRICALLATAEPRWRPGTMTGYHSYTFGYLVGELARRATGQRMRDLLRHWISEPLGLEDQLYFGVPDDRLPELARLEDGVVWPGDPPDNASVLAPWERQPRAEIGNHPEILRADIPSVGTVTARGLAAMYNALLTGRLVDAAQLRKLSAVAFEGDDQVFGNPARMALGYPVGRLGAPASEDSAAFGWVGGGGSYAYADPATTVAFALTKNQLTPHFATAQAVTEMVADYVTKAH